jgi:ferric-dicitrate binding protein FerR (iron transport regulator)
MRNHRRLLTAIALSGALAAGMAAAEDTSYSYVRVLDGSASVVSGGGDGAEPLELNQPLLTGDRIVVAASSRLEVVLADRTRLRLDAGSTAVLRAIAFSADATDRATRLQLSRGTLQLSVDENAQGDELPRIDLPNATVYVQDVGDLSVATVGGDSSEVVVRRGFVEIATERGSTLLARRPASPARVGRRRDSFPRHPPMPSSAGHAPSRTKGRRVAATTSTTASPTPRRTSTTTARG